MYKISISLTVFCCIVVRSLKKKTPSKKKKKNARFVLFHLLKSVLLISSVFWVFFSERWQSTLFQILLMFKIIVKTMSEMVMAVVAGRFTY